MNPYFNALKRFSTMDDRDADLRKEIKETKDARGESRQPSREEEALTRLPYASRPASLGKPWKT